MIIEIALGIVLAVIILRFLPQILAFGVLSIAAIAVLGIAGFVIVWVTKSWESRYTADLLVMGGFIGGLVALAILAGWVSRRTVFTEGEFVLLVALVGLLGLLVASALVDFEKYGYGGDASGRIGIGVLVVLATMATVWWRLRKRTRDAGSFFRKVWKSERQRLGYDE